MIKTIGAVLVLTATAAASWTIDVSPPPDKLTPAEQCERAAWFFPWWPPTPCHF